MGGLHHLRADPADAGRALPGLPQGAGPREEEDARGEGQGGDVVVRGETRDERGLRENHQRYVTVFSFYIVNE